MIAAELDTQIDGRSVRYVEFGQGEFGFLCVHGLGGCWQHWTQTLPLLAKHGRVIALDLPGFGGSQMPRHPISLDLLADTGARLVHQRGLERVVVVGHSMGGPIALRFARRHPKLTHGLIFVGATVATFAALLGGREVPHNTRRRPLTTLATYTEALTTPLPLPSPLKRAIARSRALRRATLWPYVWRPAGLPPQIAALILAGAGAKGALPTARAIGHSDPYDGLGEVGCPILAIGAEHDHIAPLADLHAFKRLAPHAKCVLLADAGHMMMLERPALFNGHLDDFLAAQLPPVRASPHRAADQRVHTP